MANNNNEQTAINRAVEGLLSLFRGPNTNSMPISATQNLLMEPHHIRHDASHKTPSFSHVTSTYVHPHPRSVLTAHLHMNATVNPWGTTSVQPMHKYMPMTTYRQPQVSAQHTTFTSHTRMPTSQWNGGNWNRVPLRAIQLAPKDHNYSLQSSLTVNCAPYICCLFSAFKLFPCCVFL